MRIETLLTSLFFYDMDDVFQVIPEEMLDALQTQLNDVFKCQEAVSQCVISLAADPADVDLMRNKNAAIILSSQSVANLDVIDIHTSNFL